MKHQLANRPMDRKVMTDQNEKPNDQQALEADAEQLTAYLDGELSGEELAGVEQRLLDDESFRDLMQRLQASWDMLDSLPQIGVRDALVRTTMEMVALAADADNEPRRRSWLPTWLGVLLGFALIPAAVGWASYLMTTQQNRAPRAELIENLPLIENYDRYTRVDLDIEFLESLDAADLFTSEVISLFPPAKNSAESKLDDDVSLLPSQELFDQRDERLKSMLPRQLESIKRNQAEFDLLSDSQRRGLAEFHRRLIKHPKRDDINQTLVDYYDWLKSLGQSERTELLDTPDIPSRIKLIAAKIKQQNLKAFGKAGATKLPAADAEALFGWYDSLIKQKQKKIRRSAAVVYIDIYKKQRGENPPTSELQSFQRKPLSQLMNFIFKYDRKTINPMIRDQDISRLKNLLSSDANAILDAGFSAAERTRLIINWINAANQSRFSISQEKLRSFYDGLSDRQRDKLDNLSPADWRNDLIRMYRKRQLNLNADFDADPSIFNGG